MYKRLYILEDELFDKLLIYLGVDMVTLRMWCSIDNSGRKMNSLQVDAEVNTREFKVKSILRHSRIDFIENFLKENGKEIQITEMENGHNSPIDFVDCPRCHRRISNVALDIHSKCPHCGYELKTRKKSDYIKCPTCSRIINSSYEHLHKRCPYCGHKFKEKKKRTIK